MINPHHIPSSDDDPKSKWHAHIQQTLVQQQLLMHQLEQTNDKIHNSWEHPDGSTTEQVDVEDVTIDHAAGVALTHPAAALDLPPLDADILVDVHGQIHFTEHTSGDHDHRNLDLADIDRTTRQHHPDADPNDRKPTGPFCPTCLNKTSKDSSRWQFSPTTQLAGQLAQASRTAAKKLHRWQQATRDLQQAAEQLTTSGDANRAAAICAYETAVRNLQYHPLQFEQDVSDDIDLHSQLTQTHRNLVARVAPTLETYRTAATPVLPHRAAADHVSDVLQNLDHPDQETCSRWYRTLTQVMADHQPNLPARPGQQITSVTFAWWELRSVNAETRPTTTSRNDELRSVHSSLFSTVDLTPKCIRQMCDQLDQWAQQHITQHTHQPPRRTVLHQDDTDDDIGDAVAESSMLLSRTLHAATTQHRNYQVLLTPAGWHPTFADLHRTDGGAATEADTPQVLDTVQQLLADTIGDHPRPSRGLRGMQPDPALVTDTWAATTTAHQPTRSD